MSEDTNKSNTFVGVDLKELPSYFEKEIEEKRQKEKEYAVSAQNTIEEARRRVENEGPGALESVLEDLYRVEKMTRQAGQAENTTKLVEEIIKLCGENKSWKLLNENILVIHKKRNQLKQAITKMVQTAMEYLDITPTKETKVELINTLRQVCEGKIYVEVEQAHLVRTLATIKEEEGNIEEAANLIQTIQVETIGSMVASEKISLILMQMRLCLAKKDYVRSYIISKKITARSLAQPQHKELKIKYYQLLIEYWLTKNDYLEVTRCYKEIFDSVKDDEDVKQWESILQNLVMFICLSPYDNHQSDLKYRIWREKRLEEPNMRLFQELLKCFVNTEVIHWPTFDKNFGVHLKSHSVFQNNDRYDELRNRIVEHNLRIISSYYTRLSFRRLSELVNLSAEKSEEFVSKLVTNKTIHAKIDRINGVINFTQRRSESDVLNEWNHDIEKLLDLVEKSNHLISKELMLHAAK